MSSLTVNETQINFYQFIFNFLTISRRHIIQLKFDRFVHYSNIWLSQFYQFDSKTNYFLMSFIFVKSKWLTAINKRRILVLSPLYICWDMLEVRMTVDNWSVGGLGISQIISSTHSLTTFFFSLALFFLDRKQLSVCRCVVSL